MTSLTGLSGRAHRCSPERVRSLSELVAAPQAQSSRGVSSSSRGGRPRTPGWRTRRRTSSPSARLTANSPMRSSGTRTVVSDGTMSRSVGMSSKPATRTSSGTETPASRAAASAPTAMTSLTANTTSGRTSVGQELGHRRVPAVTREVTLDASDDLAHSRRALGEALGAVARREVVAGSGEDRVRAVPARGERPSQCCGTLAVRRCHGGHVEHALTDDRDTCARGAAVVVDHRLQGRGAARNRPGGRRRSRALASGGCEQPRRG
jgi:hypothetical protein